jgi:hypothetical protein
MFYIGLFAEQNVFVGSVQNAACCLEQEIGTFFGMAQKFGFQLHS